MAHEKAFMKTLEEVFPPEKRLINIYLNDGTEFIGSYHHGGATGIGTFDGEYTDHYFEQGTGDYDLIKGWSYVNES